MEELLYNSKEEIKRADHLIFVSLKYTRTVDMFRHILKRMANALEFALDGLLEHLKKKKKIKEIPPNPTMKGDVVKEYFVGDKKIEGMVKIYLFFRKIIREKEYTSSKEYRRHVAMNTIVDNENVEINIDKIHEYFEEIKDYVNYVEMLVSGKNE